MHYLLLPLLSSSLCWLVLLYVMVLMQGLKLLLIVVDVLLKRQRMHLDQLNERLSGLLSFLISSSFLLHGILERLRYGLLQHVISVHDLRNRQPMIRLLRLLRVRKLLLLINELKVLGLRQSQYSLCDLVAR